VVDFESNKYDLNLGFAVQKSTTWPQLIDTLNELTDYVSGTACPIKTHKFT